MISRDFKANQRLASKPLGGKDFTISLKANRGVLDGVKWGAAPLTPHKSCGVEVVGGCGVKQFTPHTPPCKGVWGVGYGVGCGVTSPTGFKPEQCGSFDPAEPGLNRGPVPALDWFEVPATWLDPLRLLKGCRLQPPRRRPGGRTASRISKLTAGPPLW